MKTIDDLDVSGKRVLLRADLNVPLDGTRITDDGKLRACLPTVSALLDRGAGVVICSHLGRPAGVPRSRVVARASRRAPQRAAGPPGEPGGRHLRAVSADRGGRHGSRRRGHA